MAEDVFALLGLAGARRAEICEDGVPLTRADVARVWRTSGPFLGAALTAAGVLAFVFDAAVVPAFAFGAAVVPALAFGAAVVLTLVFDAPPPSCNTHTGATHVCERCMGRADAKTPQGRARQI